MVKAEVQMADPLTPVFAPRNTEPVQSPLHTRTAPGNEEGDLAGGEVLRGAKRPKPRLAPQTQSRLKPDDVLDERRRSDAGACS